MPDTTAETRAATPTLALGDDLIRVVKLLHVVRQHAPRRHPQVDPMAYPLLFNLKAGSLRVSALAERLHSDVSTVSRQVTTLVDLGFVTRGPDPDDGRAQALTLTAEGDFLYLDANIAYGTWISVEVLIACILGGSGTVLGPVIGALALHGAGEAAKIALAGIAGPVPGIDLMLFGALLILAVAFLPQGVMGGLRRAARGLVR